MPTSISTDLKHWLTVVASLDPGLLERSTLDHWVDQRLRQLRLSGVHEYLRVLREDGDELERLVGEISVPETWFFRYPASFRLLIDFARELRMSATPPKTLKMLSIACATGEEPYSMAMAAAHAGWPFSQILVDAIDRNPRWLETARQATYGQRSLRETPPDWTEAWLRQSADCTTVDSHVVSVVNFTRADVLDARSFDGAASYDVIFCRNLLIYLNEGAQKNLISTLDTRLSPHGLLFVGHAESMDSFQSRFRRVSTPHTFALRLRHASGQEPSNRTLPGPHRRPTSTVRKPASSAAKRPDPVDTPTRPAKPAGQPADRSAATEATLEQARALADAGELALSLASAKSVLVSEGPTASILELLGHIHLALGDLSDARDALTKALYFEPDREDVLLQLSMIHQRLGETTQAERYRQRAARSHQINQNEQ